MCSSKARSPYRNVTRILEPNFVGYHTLTSGPTIECVWVRGPKNPNLTWLSSKLSIDHKQGVDREDLILARPNLSASSAFSVLLYLTEKGNHGYDGECVVGQPIREL